MSTVINGSTGINKVQDGSIQPEDLAQKMTLMEAKTASGTFVDFTGIPSWAKRITVMCRGISTSGTSPIIFQVGSVADGMKTTGYSGAVMGSSGSAVGTVSLSNGLGSKDTFASADSYNIEARILKFSALAINMSSQLAAENAIKTGNAVSVTTLTGDLDRLRITTVSGTDTFDAGTINIMYEG